MAVEAVVLSGPRKGGPLSCVESLLLEQNPTLIYLRNVKSFVFRAGSTLPKMGLPRATAFRFGQGHFEAVFNFYFNSRRDQKRPRQIHALERVAILFLGLRHDARNAPSCSKSSPETMKPQAGRMTQTYAHAELRGAHAGGPFSTSQYQPAKWLCLNECFSPGSQASCWALLRFGAMAPRSKCKTNRLSV